MVAAVSSRSRPSGSTTKSLQPPTKRAKLSQQPSEQQSNGLEAILSGARRGQKLTAVAINGVKRSGKNNVDESRAVVGRGEKSNGDVDMQDVNGGEVVEISSDEEEDESDYESSGDEQAEAGAAEQPAAHSSDVPAKDTEMVGGDVEGMEEPADTAGAAEPEEPSFGEMLQANAPEPIDIEASFADPTAQSKELVPTVGNRTLTAPSATSLGTVLTQALKTNDRQLLESCFEMNDLDSVRSTIERLPSPLVSNLLQRLAERLHNRPGRAGNLLIWVQWSLVSHGGYLAGQQDVVRRLGSLNRVIKERASGLQPLLTLKGKLDMLSAQMELRRSMQRSAAVDEEDDDEGVIYVEGEDEGSDEAEVEVPQPAKAINGGVPPPKMLGKGGRLRDFEGLGESESSGDEGEDMPTTVNGLDLDVDEDEDESEDENEMLDDEAAETENDTGDETSDEDELDREDDDGEDLSESEAEETRPAKRSTAALRSGFGRKR
ncbi:Small subunit (SSU) processome component [Coniosporium apollinis]|uniref:Small subunit (SSU) processome component n=1 Tax=Coniosporium apollinis TaxID=61459 RepID=A0ABQ9NNS8_9PEZI|nr:Small subunit (SSU) processome component [Coniosporium apollinis]